MLRVEGVTKSFSGFRALSEVNFRVEPGQVTAVIGPNGAGKTTLFNVLTGHLKPDSGRILFQNTDIAGRRPHQIFRRGIARSFQLTNVFSRLTVLENVQVALLAREGKSGSVSREPGRECAARAQELLARVGLGGWAGEPAGKLSYGDQKLLEITMALAGRPQLLLLDEPTAGMSPEETAATAGLIRQLAEEGVTVLFTEHDVDLVFGLAAKIVVLHQGCCIAQGTPGEVRGDRTVQKAYLGEES
ncbi:MAG TPA: ABC transporter ATP-binding protein [Spirochaetia bacterium]|nr:ABC transporter ATP-binding protein [Spirochaetia bacterium]